MERSQQYLTTLLERLPKQELADPGHQDAFERIKESLSSSEDFNGRLKTLYKVANFSEFALGLMWIADKVERDPSKLESSTEEETFVFGLLKNAFGEIIPMESENAPAVVEPSSPTDFGQEPAPEQENGFGEMTPVAPEPAADQAPPMSDTSAVMAAPEGAFVGSNEQSFSAILEKLLEAIQSGSESRNSLLDELTAEASRIVAQPDTTEDFKAFCGYMIEFLKYVTTNQLFDDIRVLNMMSNVFDPFSQWAKADPAARAGLLDQPNEMLREFKALFE